jgi:hypothetical protein
MERTLSERFLREDNLVNDLLEIESSTMQPGYRPKGTYLKKPNTDSQEWVLAFRGGGYIAPKHCQNHSPEIPHEAGRTASS